MDPNHQASLRLECLRLAQARAEFNGEKFDNVIENAKAYAAFVLERSQ